MFDYYVMYHPIGTVHTLVTVADMNNIYLFIYYEQHLLIAGDTIISNEQCGFVLSTTSCMFHIRGI